MSYALPSYLWPPQRRGIEQTIDLLEQGKDVCLYGPTGSGKTTQAVELFNWAMSHGDGAVFYLNRRLLIPQTAERFSTAMLPFGIRAAGYDDRFDFSAPYQICSADTEKSRVYVKNIWKLHPAKLVVVDEMHLQKTGVMKQIIADYRAMGARVVGLTATPVGLKSWVDNLVVSGTMAEYRACNALVPAIVKSISQPDLSKVKRNKTGEYILDGKKRAIYTQSIVGEVIERWKRYNPDARPTMLFAPGVAESVWFTEQFQKIGVNWAHIDATDAVVDGHRAKLTRTLWDEIMERFKAGDIKGLSCRYKLREGIDVPFAYHAIFAAPIGSLASYIQSIGRIMRYSLETPDHVLVTDHGGNYHRFGSPNHDRDWASWWDLPEGAVSTMFSGSIKNGTTPEPIVCPKCEGERLRGTKCPFCGFEHQKSIRHVVQEDGTMRTVEGALVRPKLIRLKPDTAKLWKKLVMGAWKWKRNRSFKQLEAWFFHEHHYYPPRNIPFMPRRPDDWCRKVCQVPMEQLT